MPCPKTLNLNLAAGDNFYPLHTAVYCAASGTILGSMGNYIVEFNATTAAVIRAVKVISPMYGPTHICLAGVDPWIACYNDRSNVIRLNPDASHVNTDIFPVDPSTLLLGSGLGLPNKAWAGGQYGAVEGPRQFLQVGTRIYFLWPYGQKVNIGYVDKTNHAINAVTAATFSFWSEQFCTDGTFLYTADPGSPEIDQWDTNLGSVDYSSTDEGGGVVYWPVGTGFAASTSKVHAVTATKWLIRVDDFTVHHGGNTYIDLEALIGGAVTGIKPLRIRYRSSDGKFYIPVQNKNGIIVYDPVAATAVWKSGFDSPVDVVFTPTKAFAVLSSDAGLKEIV